ncbi:hypothetical protein OHA70_33280 [Kribbella sp. NBC_00382]|uniref:hypothetical protein n=1 Tax=Kribbella sp. NBC_00382 TaxID=2975967 RepID=UPI002E2483D1
MKELGVDLAEVKIAFEQVQDEPFVLIKVSAEAAGQWAELLGVPARRCYLTDEALAANAERTGYSRSEIVKAKTPDAGSVMAGDFGELVTAFFLAAREHPVEVNDPKKWRLKQDRLKAAPYSDVVQFILHDWPTPSADDRLICAEVKTKSTNGASTPIASAIADSQKDREGRLAKTLLWLKARGLGEALGSVDIEQLDRFINAVDHPPATREFHAVVVICSSLVDAEIADVQGPGDECALVVISVPDLKSNYQALYEAIVASAMVETQQA